MLSSLVPIAIIYVLALLSSPTSTSAVEASSLQSEDFKECFCFDSNTNSWCTPGWVFFNVASCRNWLFMNLAWLIGIFIVSNIFFFAACVFCCSASGSKCFCCASKSPTKGNSRKHKWYFTSTFLGMIGCMVGMTLTSTSWASTTGNTIDGAKSVLQETLNLLQNEAASIEILGSYPSSSFAYADVPSFVTTSQIALAKVDETAVTDTQKTMNDIFPYVKRMTTNHIYGRPALVSYACTVAFIALLVIFIFMLCNRNGCTIGGPGALFAIVSYFICGYLVSTSITLAVLTSDICAVYDATFVPVVRDAARVALACDRDYVAAAAAQSLSSFSSFVYNNKDSAACGDIRLLDPSAVPDFGCVDPFPDATAIVNNYTNYALPNISSFGIAYNKTRVTTLTHETITVDECFAIIASSSQPSSSSKIAPNDVDACKRLHNFYYNVFIPTSYIGYEAAPDTQDCFLLTTTMTGHIKELVCVDFKPAVRDFAIAGGSYLLVGLCTLLTIRWGCHHFKSPEQDPPSVTTARNSNNVVFVRTASDLESMSTYPSGGPPMENMHYFQSDIQAKYGAYED